MSVWGKIKNILFEDDEEVVEEMPVYTKEDVEEKKEIVEKKEPVVEEKPIEVSEHPTFNNVKRDVYMPFEDDVLEEIPTVERAEKLMNDEYLFFEYPHHFGQTTTTNERYRKNITLTF